MTAPDTASAAPHPIAVKSLSAASLARPLPTAPVIRAASAYAPVLRLLSSTGRLEVLIEARDRRDLPALQAQANLGRLCVLIGDDSELESFNLGECYANLLQWDVDLRLGKVRCSTSAVGLPPVFLIESAQGTGLAAPFRPDRAHGLSLGRINVEAAADVLRWGHPINDRTLAGNLRLAPVGACICLSEDGLDIAPLATAPWDPKEGSADIANIIEQQMAAFGHAASRLTYSSAFISLSGGLDSRAVAMATIAAGRVAPCITLARDHRSLDSQLAAAFCKAYGLEHRIILTNAQFRRGLADRVVKCADLTLGVSALSQTVDLFLYEQLANEFRSRISGNLGNQVGRGGVESVTVSTHPDEVFSPELRHALQDRPAEPWYVERMRARGFSQTLFTEEVNYWSIPNYVLGSAHAVQLTPYADRHLIQLSTELFAAISELHAPTTQSIRRRDLRHRLAGPPISQSFQRSLLRKADTRGRNVAINWGWLARGGWSPRWLLAALPTVASAALGKFSPAVQRASSALPPFGLADWPMLLRNDLRDLAHDCLASEAVRSSGLFDREKMSRLVERHFRGTEQHYGTVSRVMEITLGCQVIAEDVEVSRADRR
jgi:hypothetical protein